VPGLNPANQQWVQQWEQYLLEEVPKGLKRVFRVHLCLIFRLAHGCGSGRVTCFPFSALVLLSTMATKTAGYPSAYPQYAAADFVDVEKQATGLEDDPADFAHAQMRLGFIR
jgi:hypothetical protein